MAYELDKDCYLRVTPAGAYYCVSSAKEELARSMLKVLLTSSTTPLLSNSTVESLFSVESSIALRLLHHLQKLNWIEFVEHAESVNDGKVETLYSRLLPCLSLEGKVLLADAEGVSIASVGFTPVSVRDISYLSADILSLHRKHRWLLNDSLKYPTSNWGTLDAAGHSQIGFWPLHIGKEVISLVIHGVPKLTDDAFLQLTWLLHTRYQSKISQQPSKSSFQSNS